MKSPILLQKHMVEKNQIVQLTEEGLGEGQFIVDLSISQSNKITILIDSEHGITIDDCARLSRHIESKLNRDEEDFELQVSSSGLGQPFKVYKQYLKNSEKEVEVVLATGQRYEGVLKNVEQTGFDLEITKNEKVEGEKKKRPVTRLSHFSFDKIKTVRNIIKF